MEYVIWESSIVHSGVDIVLQLSSPHTLLVFDSYYLDETGKELLNDTGVKYIGAIQSNRFPFFFTFLSPNVKISGDIAEWHHPINSESILLYNSPDTNIGKKFVTSNNFHKGIINLSSQFYDHCNHAFFLLINSIKVYMIIHVT